MSDVRALTMIEFALDDLYEKHHHPGKQEILEAVREIDPPPEYVDYFERLPIGTYSRQRLEEMLNDTVTADGKQDEIGYLR